VATTRANGIEIYYEVHGEGPPLLLIMGLGANATAWWNQVPALSEQYRVIAFDNRGAGRSEKPSGVYSIAQMADDAAALMDALDMRSSHVFGMSLGGMIAQEYALRHPQRVQALVLGGTTPGGPKAMSPGPEVMGYFATVASLPIAQAIERGMSLLYSDEFLAANKDWLVKRAIENASLMAPAHGLRGQVMAAISHNTFGRLGSINAPTLVLSGTADKIVPHPNSVLISGGIPGARLVQYEGAGHGFLVERADEVNEAVLRFLGASEGQPSPK
jgi:pimeloyl-ACP methyl ester carboxylesterase